jgi:cellulose synthase/poly-beta-1,6-N-acetylglucosamine synthase-like glycosyltransferase
MAKVDIIVPSYGRQDILGRCLTALLAQDLQDIEVLCVCRHTDSKTQAVVADFCRRDKRVREVPVYKPGFVAALNAGLSSATAPFVCFTDDDAEAPPHWLQTLMDHFASHPECGAAGGPDRLQVGNKKFSNPPPAKKVGVYSWTGKWHATHHCPIQEVFFRVRILKGVNMVYRSECIRNHQIGEGLRGGGAQVGTEQGLAASVQRSGKELHFVRDAWLLHHCAPRQEGSNRAEYLTQFAFDTSYNTAYTLWRYQPTALSTVVQIRNLLVGNRHVPGLLRLLAAPGKAPLTAKHFAPALSGAMDGLLARHKAP